jgi:hypothetical protein
LLNHRTSTIANLAVDHPYCSPQSPHTETQSGRTPLKAHDTPERDGRERSVRWPAASGGSVGGAHRRGIDASWRGYLRPPAALRRLQSVGSRPICRSPIRAANRRNRGPRRTTEVPGERSISERPLRRLPIGINCCGVPVSSGSCSWRPLRDVLEACASLRNAALG